MKRRYRYCGFDIESAIEFPELDPSLNGNEEVPIAIETAPIKIPDDDSLRYGPNWAVGQAESFWWLDGIVKFRITENSISIDANENVAGGLIRALLLEAPLTLAMQYRGAFCLAVSAVADDKGVQAFRFLSGGGSSSTAAWQVVRSGGRTLCSDTLLRISVNEAGKPLAWPQGSGVLLWPRARKLLDLHDKPMLEVRPELPLRRVQLNSTSRPLPLQRIYTAALYRRLEESSQEDMHFVEARRPFRLAALKTAGRLWIDPMGKTAEHFAWCLAIARHCQVELGTKKNLYP